MSASSKHQDSRVRVMFLRLFPRLSFDGKRLRVLWLGATLILGTLIFTFHRIGDYAVETDFYWSYAPHAAEILHGKIAIDQFKGPGYELVLAVVGAVMGDFFRAGVLISVLSAAGVAFLTFRLLAILWDRETAFLVSCGLAVNFTFLTSAYTASTDMFFNLLMVGTATLLVGREHWTWRDVALAGALSGYAYLTRYNAIALIVAGIGGLLFLSPASVPWRRRGAGALLFSAAFLLVVGPWLLYTKSQTGSFFFNNNFFNIAYEMYGKGRFGWDEYWATLAPRFHSYADVVAYDPARFAGQLAFNTVDHLWKDMTLLVSPAIGLPAAGGLVAVIVTRMTRWQGRYLLISLVSYGVLLPVFYGERFSLYLAPTMFLLAVLFFKWRMVPLGAREGGGLRIALVGAAILIGGVAGVQRVAAEIGSGPVELLDLRAAYRARYPHAEEGAKLVARKPHVAYYLDMAFVPFPYVGTIDDLRREVRTRGATHLYYSVVEAGMRPEFQFLLDPRRAPEGFEPMLQVNNPPGVLYRLRLP
jgi:hypothetical protein